MNLLSGLSYRLDNRGSAWSEPEKKEGRDGTRVRYGPSEVQMCSIFFEVINGRIGPRVVLYGRGIVLGRPRLGSWLEGILRSTSRWGFWKETKDP